MYVYMDVHTHMCCMYMYMSELHFKGHEHLLRDDIPVPIIGIYMYIYLYMYIHIYK
jgi:hypothetical protein